MFADLAGRFGLDVRGFQVGKAVMLGVLLVLGKVICFSFATLLWPLRVAAPTTNFVTNIPPAPATSIAPPTPVMAASLPTNFVTSIRRRRPRAFRRRPRTLPRQRPYGGLASHELRDEHSAGAVSG